MPQEWPQDLFFSVWVKHYYPHFIYIDNAVNNIFNFSGQTFE